MSKNNDGGSAFPNDYCNPSSQGMSLRDWFAGQALAGQLANADSEINMTFLAKWSYEYADAMLAERKKQKGGDA